MTLFLVTDLVSVRLVARVKYAAAERGFIGIFFNEVYECARLGVFSIATNSKFRQLNYFKNLFFIFDQLVFETIFRNKALLQNITFVYLCNVQ